MAKFLCGFAALCSLSSHTAVAVLRGVRSEPWPSGPWAWPPANEDGFGDGFAPVGGGGEEGGEPERGSAPDGDDVAPVGGGGEEGGEPERGDAPDGSGGDVPVVPISEDGGDAPAPDGGDAPAGGGGDVPVVPISEDGTKHGVGRGRRGRASRDHRGEWDRIKPKISAEQEARLTAGTSGKDNLCLGDAMVPELMIIGAMVAATGSFNVALAYSPALKFPNRTDLTKGEIGLGEGWEFGQGHFFDLFYTKGRPSMGAAYPPCDRSKREVAVDSTSRYAQDPLVPAHINSWYGVVLGERIKFVFVLREPLERLHSHYWQAIQGKWCKTLPKSGFKAFVKSLVGGLDGWYVAPGNVAERVHGIPLMHRCQEMLGASEYAPQLSLWMAAFDARQFTIIPFQYITSGDSERSEPAEYLWHVLGVRGLPPPRVFANSNEEPHPGLDEEIDEKTKAKFWKRYHNSMAPEVVAAILASSEAILYQFGTQPRTTESVTQWLNSTW